jgi:hypothetical protein
LFAVLSLLAVVWAGCGSASDDIVIGGVAEPVEVMADESLATDGATSNSEQDVAPVVSESNGISAISELRITTFLWKPISEGDGNLVVLVDPIGVDILVTGGISENLRDTGPSNDRGTTARGSFPGCNYGRDILVEFFEEASGSRILLSDGSDSVRIDDGCNRIEF